MLVEFADQRRSHSDHGCTVCAAARGGSRPRGLRGLRPDCRRGVGRLPNIVEFQVHNTSAEVAVVTDYPTNAFLVELQGTTTTTSGTETINRKVRTRQWFRGIADRHIVASHFTPQGNYSNAVAALRAHLLQASNGWCLRVVSRAHEIKSVASLSITGEARVPAHGYPPRFQVRMSKINPRVGVNKIWDARTLTADTFQLERFKTLDSDWVHAGGGCCRRIEYLYPPIQEVKVLRATKRNAERPSRLYSGKTKKVLR